RDGGLDRLVVRDFVEYLKVSTERLIVANERNARFQFVEISASAELCDEPSFGLESREKRAEHGAVIRHPMEYGIAENSVHWFGQREIREVSVAEFDAIEI